jgi:glycine cleavage system aminomethyltransferase T
LAALRHAVVPIRLPAGILDWLWGNQGHGLVADGYRAIDSLRLVKGYRGVTVDRSIAYAYLPTETVVPSSEVEVEIFGRWVPGQVAEEPLLDPRGERVRS